MSLRDWVAVLVSVVLLVVSGFVGVEVNSSALRAADRVHRADTQALGVNNAMLTRVLQLNSAAELSEFIAEYPLRVTENSAADRRALGALVGKSPTFSYGAAITDMGGAVLTASRSSGLPASDDPGWRPLRQLIAAGQPGFSSIMTVTSGVHIEAVAVPIVAGGSAAGMLIGFNAVASTSLQKFLESMSDPAHTTMIVDASGTIAAVADAANIGTKVDPPIRTATPAGHFVTFTIGRTALIAIVVGGLPAGWAYVRVHSLASFEGAVHTRSQTLNLTLLAMLLIGVAGFSVLGYRTMLQRRRANERFQALFQHAPDLMSVLDKHGRIAYVSPGSSAVLGYETRSLVGATVFEIVHPEDQPYLQRQFGAMRSRRDAVLRLQCRVRSGNGEYLWFEFTASNQLDNPALTGVVINARDVSESRAYQERLTYEAEHDALTGLPNRRLMRKSLGASLRAEAVAVLFVDLDGFKAVNDVHGHDAGDELLRQVAGRLAACVRDDDVLARVGGDEFVVLIPGIVEAADAEATCARIRASIERPFPIHGVEVLIGASVGVFMAPSAGDPDEALRAADRAMYTKKRAGRQP